MNIEERERKLKKSTMCYPLKANLYLRDSPLTLCPDCPFRNACPSVSIFEKTQKCFERCLFRIIPWILNSEQLELFEKIRPPELKKKDIELAINEGKLLQIEEAIGRVRGQVPLPLF